MKKVLYIGVISEHGGAARSMLEMVNTINKMQEDIQPIVLCCHKTGHIEIYKKRGIEAYPTCHAAFGYAKEENFISFIKKRLPRYLRYKVLNLYALNYVEKHVDMNEIDLIHTNSNRNDLGMILSKRHKIPHVLHLREFGGSSTDYEVNYYRKNPFKYIDTHTDRYIAISNAVKSYWVNNYGIPTEKIDVVYNGIDESDIRIHEYTDSSNDKVKIVFTGYIMETKGQKKFLEEMSLLPRDILQKIHIDFVGSSTKEYMETLQSFINEKRLGEFVTFLGKREDVHQLLADYDIGVVCSRSEAFGRVTAEYMLARLCVLASDTGSNSELIVDNKTGLLYQYSTQGDMGQKLTTLILDTKLRKRLAQSAYDVAKKRFTTNVNAENVVRVYREIWSDQ